MWKLFIAMTKRRETSKIWFNYLRFITFVRRSYCIAEENKRQYSGHVFSFPIRSPRNIKAHVFGVKVSRSNIIFNRSWLIYCIFRAFSFIFRRPLDVMQVGKFSSAFCNSITWRISFMKQLSHKYFLEVFKIGSEQILTRILFSCSSSKVPANSAESRWNLSSAFQSSPNFYL